MTMTRRLEWSGRVLDYKQKSWGHDYTLNWDTEKKQYDGFFFSDVGIKTGDVIQLEEGELYILEHTWCGSPEDMYHVVAKVLKEGAVEELTNDEA